MSKENTGNKVGRMKKLIGQVIQHVCLDRSQKLNALNDLGCLVVQERFKEKEFMVLRDHMRVLAKDM